MFHLPVLEAGRWRLRYVKSCLRLRDRAKPGFCAWPVDSVFSVCASVDFFLLWAPVRVVFGTW